MITPEIQKERDRCVSILAVLQGWVKENPKKFGPAEKALNGILDQMEVAMKNGWTKKRETPSEFSLEEIEAAQTIIDEGQS